jgi:hypothetical protein
MYVSMAIAASCAFTQAKVVAAAAPDAKQKAREKQARTPFVCAFVVCASVCAFLWFLPDCLPRGRGRICSTY